MKTLCLLTLAVILTGCAQTVLYDRATGKAIARFQGDMTGSHYADGGTVWDVQQVSHSAATLAQGRAAGHVVTSIGTAGAGLLISAGSSGLFPAVAGVAAPALSTALSGAAATPAPLPAPTKAH
jgi:hypothetical protein